MRTLLCLHGFGVRGYFWDVIKPHLENVYARVVTPDLRMDTIETVLDSGRRLTEQSAREDGAPVAIIGHSLGGVVGALAARDLGPATVDRVVLVAPPFGERGEVPGPFLRFLLRHRLIPDFLSRPRFFSSETPTSIQKSIFKRAVDESPELKELLFRPKRFHTDLFDGPLPVPTLVVASEADRIVPVRESLEFAERLGAATEVYAAARGIGHDDFTCAPRIAEELAARVSRFAETNR
ncbi:MAG: alpha/beta hydrolase [Spirochaetaceae bacterium]